MKYTILLIPYIIKYIGCASMCTNYKNCAGSWYNITQEILFFTVWAYCILLYIIINN